MPPPHWNAHSATRHIHVGLRDASVTVQLATMPTAPVISWNENAEQAVLAAALVNKGARDKLVVELEPGDFCLQAHRGLFAGIVELLAEGREVDPVILADHLRGRPWFKNCGGSAYLHTLASLPAYASFMDEYVEIVKAHARRRHIAKIGDDLSAGRLEPSEAADRLRELAADGVRGLPFVTAMELADETPEELPAVWGGYLYRGTVAELSGKIKNGKTTFTLALAEAVITGEPFLDMPTAQGPALYLTEQNRPSFMAALERAKLGGCRDLHLLFRHECRGEWPTIAAGARRRALETQSGLVIVDTLHEWAGLGRDDENDAGAALAAMRPLHEIAAAGPAVLVLRHERKGGGEIGENARGSSAFGGSADVLMVLRRMNTAGHANRRELLALSRFDSVPPKLVIEFEDGRYGALGDGDELERSEARRRVVEHLPTIPEEAATFDAIREYCGDSTTRTTLHRALSELVKEGTVIREKGAGTAGPRGYGYWLAEVTA